MTAMVVLVVVVVVMTAAVAVVVVVDVVSEFGSRCRDRNTSAGLIWSHVMP